ncbi:hypothetical protein [Streptomyces guryensis]|uniref:Uncharacterized protein n=1 Tax=Streptomyces guryensis TaxID=2886947 RepID=A0A9Q3VW92_9ACTN|nr:hypothetical protein [Streptomyces guryensis]MCD9881103.1 hypothetical protein [Streptomyces guryensis]
MPGFAVPVAFSARAWQMYIAGQGSRLAVVLSAVRYAIAQMPHEETGAKVSGLPMASGQPSGPADELHAEMHPGDASEPVLTLILPSDY